MIVMELVKLKTKLYNKDKRRSGLVFIAKGKLNEDELALFRKLAQKKKVVGGLEFSESKVSLFTTRVHERRNGFEVIVPRAVADLLEPSNIDVIVQLSRTGITIKPCGGEH
ncbi:hypothetical protein E3E38_06015 [Thermococcus sp. 18S1]|uniref:hypothetical protein n=1 Tax=Thermococcus sp. 18S1 TaxID=1638210 RepID=UPI0014396695|nr:hypothetical protein [Thermococcus sp. 18S1]NJE30602.1 hypothetical protein [Thermococcus sp. 18S1]